MKKIIIPLLIVSVIFIGCSIIKTIRLIKSGEVEQKEFKVEIPFELRYGLIILKVKIDGTEHDFILDTGAPNVLSKELTSQLNLNTVFSKNVTDSHGEKSELDFLYIDTIDIGGIKFLNMGAAVADLTVSPEIACLGIDGFIGSNLMKKAIWDIDFENQIITITNSLSSLDIPANSEKTAFIETVTGTPVISITLSGQTEKNVSVDLGSNGGFRLSGKTYDKLVKNKSITSYTFSYGAAGSGLYGAGEPDTTKYAIVPEISIADITLKNQVVSFTKKRPKLLGTKFFKNYRLILNWFDKELIMIKKQEYNNTKLVKYGFSKVLRKNKMYVGILYNNSCATDNGLMLDDQIIEINGQDYTTVLQEQWCEIMKDQNDTIISITVLREGGKLTFDLKKTTLLE